MNMSFTCFTTAIHSLCYIHTDVFNRWLTSLSLLHVAQCHYLWTSGNKEASPPQWTHCRHSVDFHVAVVTTASFRTPLCLWLVWLLRLCVSVIRRCALWKWRNTTRMLHEILQQRSTTVTWRFSGFPVWSKTYMYNTPPPTPHPPPPKQNTNVLKSLEHLQVNVVTGVTGASIIRKLQTPGRNLLKFLEINRNVRPQDVCKLFT